MLNSPVPIPQKSNWANLYLKEENAQTKRLRELIATWCAAKGKSCNIVLVGKRELPLEVKEFPCLRTSAGYVNGAAEIRRFLQQEIAR